MMIEVTIPKLGLTMEKATVVEWKCRAGDRVTKDQVLLVIETEKITYEVASPADGIVQPIVSQGAECKVEEVVAIIAENESEYKQIRDKYVPTLPEEQSQGHVSDQVAAKCSNHKDTVRRVKASPLARSIASRHNIALEQIKGTGPGGRIVKADVLVAIENQKLASEAPPSHEIEQKADIVPIKGARKVIFDNMWKSLSQSAQLTLHTDASAVNIISLRERFSRLGNNVSYNALFIKLVATSLVIHPKINASVSNGHIHMWKNINIGLAMEKDEVLVVPVIRDADKKSIVEIENEVSALISKARTNSLSPDDLTGGTFTISNLGFAGIDYFTPIIRPPESAILGIGRITEKPWIRNGQVIAEPRVGLSLTFDHRIIDGAPAARFLSTIREFIEEPSLLLVHEN